jgi:predicted nucleic acid-binding protein
VGFLKGLPESALVYVDSCILIYSVEKIRPYWPRLRELWADAVRGRMTVCTSEIALMEVLVGPLKRNDVTLADAYEELMANEVRCLPITRPILRAAARLRAAAGLKTPDAIHAATALEEGCDLFITNDAHFQRVPGLDVAVLADVVSS